MAFSLDHWKNPRLTIATKFQHNDIAYITHGAMMAMEALRMIDKPASELKKLTLLDYGCGTGRMSRVLSGLFGKVYAYDPVQECINLAKTECRGLNFPNLMYFTDIQEVPKADMAICINVIEHLVDSEALTLIDNLKNKVAGPTYLWYSTTKNSRVMHKYLSSDQISQDNTNGSIVIREFDFS